MTEWIVTSSVLIVVVVLLRQILKGKISLRLQYALWALVLLRLLIPGSLFNSPVSVMNVVPNEPAGFYQEEPGQEVEPPVVSVGPAVSNIPVVPSVPSVPEVPAVTLPPVNGNGPVVTPEEPIELPWGQVLRTVWYVGMAAMALCLLISNLRFWLRLRRSREVLKFSPPTLYVTESIETPCLFGLFAPGIYVTPEVAKDKVALSHVLAHEQTHYRHKDHIWALLRCVCLVLHWYNPLVWLAASLSRRDGELACDEGAIRVIGEGERASYGRTLISLTCTRRGGLLQTATTMTGSKKSIKERIALIARKPKMKLYTLIAVILIAVIAAGCTFTGELQREGEGFERWIDDLEGLVWDRDLDARVPEQDLTEEVFREELMPILQGIKAKDFEGEPGPDSASGIEEQKLAVLWTEWSLTDAVSGFVFTCLPEKGMLQVDCFVDESYGIEGRMLLNYPALYDFIVKYTEMGTSDTFDRQVEDYIQQMMKGHAAELTVQLGYEVSVGAIQEMTLVELGSAGSTKVCQVDYYLLHHLPRDEDGDLVYGGIVSYTQYMFLLHQGDSVILLGHADETTLSNVYSTPEMIDKYGDMYKAAAMEMYYRYQIDRAYNMALLAHPDAVETARFDLNGDGYDELIVKSGNSEADYAYTFYVYRNGVQGADPIGRVDGGDSYLAVHEGQLIVAGSSGAMEWAYRVTWEDGLFASEELYRRVVSGAAAEYPYRVLTLPVAGELTDTPAAEAESFIKESYIAHKLQDIDEKPDPDQIWINDYYGEYGDCHVAIVGSVWFGRYQATWSQTVDGVTFHYPDSRQIEVFRADGIYTLEEAFDGGLLTHEDLAAIAHLHNDRYGAGRIAAYSDPASALESMMEKGSGGSVLLTAFREDGEQYTTVETGYDSGYYTAPMLKAVRETSWIEAEKPEGWDWGTQVFAIHAADWSASLFFYQGDGLWLQWVDNTSANGGSLTDCWWKTDSDAVLTGLLDSYDRSYWTFESALGGPSADAEEMAQRVIEALGEVQMNLRPGNVYRITDYKVVEQKVLVCAPDGDHAAVGVKYAFKPAGNINFFASGNLWEGEGEYEGWWLKYGELSLERDENGVWHVYGPATGGILPMFEYDHNRRTSFYGNTKEYHWPGDDPVEAAQAMVKAYVDDLMAEGNMLFTVTEYRDLVAVVTPTTEVEPGYLFDHEIGEKIWYVDLSLEYRFDGLLLAPPIGPGGAHNADEWFSMTHQGSHGIGFLMTWDGQKFTLQSRYDSIYA